MKFIVLFSLALTATLAKVIKVDSRSDARINQRVQIESTTKLISSLKDEQMAIQEELIRSVNKNVEASWKAGVNEKFVGWSVADVKRLLGARTTGVSKLPRVSHSSYTLPIPANFDWRTSKANCVGPVRDQGDCGSCWAEAATEALGDRFCIARGLNASYVELSVQNMISCDDTNMGCDGGDLGAAWDWLASNGVTTAGCTPYLIPGCNPTPCLPPFQPTPSCNKTCADGEIYAQSKHFAASSYAVSSSVKDIEVEIMKNGPVEAAFTVYQDFLNYKTGIYKHTSGQALGGHAIKIIGWITIGSQQAWICQNSWNTHWGGLGGYFYILKGRDECGIESNVVAGHPKI